MGSFMMASGITMRRLAILKKFLENTLKTMAHRGWVNVTGIDLGRLVKLHAFVHERGPVQLLPVSEPS
jgi:hypothetical protein